MAESLDTSTPGLFDPVRIGTVRLKNRIFVAPHTTNFAERNQVSHTYVEYLRERARGGAGLIITEAVRVHPSSLRRFGVGGWGSAAVDGLRLLADTVHDHGAALFAQVMHTGRHDGSEWTGMWGPSGTAWMTGTEVPHRMSLADINLIRDAFGRTVRNVVEAGLDGAEIHLGHGHLLQQFLSPVTNARTDGYGGSPEARLRLTREVLGTAFDAAAGRIPLGVRLSAEEMMTTGLQLGDMLEIVAELVEAYPVEFLHVSHSAYAEHPSLATQMPDMSFPTAPFRSYPAAFKQRFPDVPVLAVCRVDDVDTAAELLATGAADLVGMARAHIADPEIARKAQSGRQHEIRSCIACNQACVGHLERTLPIRCLVNPEVGLEREWRNVPQPARRQRVLVVGGGPAGLEAAVTARRRGHDVLLVDRNSELGGQVGLVRTVTGRERLGLLVDELARAASSVGVQVELERSVSAGAVASGGWDVVVLATGSRPAPVPRHLPALSVWEAIVEPERVGNAAVVVDEDGGWSGACLAEHLASSGRRVVMVTSMDAVSRNITTYSKLSFYDRLGRLGVQVKPLRRLGRMADATTAVLVDTITGAEELLPDVETVVTVGPRVANDELFLELVERDQVNVPVHVVGDAFAPRSILEATSDGRGAGTLVGVEIPDDWTGPPIRMPYEGGHRGGDLLQARTMT